MQTFKGVAWAGCDLPNDESLAAQIRTTAVLTEKQLADWLGLSEKSLRRQVPGDWFALRQTQLGRNASVRYYLPHVLDHLEKCKRVPSVRAAFEGEIRAKKTRSVLALPVRTQRGSVLGFHAGDR